MTTMTTTAPFALIPPARAASPLLVEVPHAGLDIPPEVRGELAIGDDQLLRDSDIYVDRLCAEAPQLGATLLVARVARCVVDLNRDPADGLHPLTPLGAPAFAPPILPRPHGVVWTVSTASEPILRVPFTPDLVERRVARYHAPYHATLRRELERLRATFGFAVLLAAHSMPSWGVDPRTGARIPRADVVPGSQARTCAADAVIDAIDEHFRALGYSVAHDAPYRGGYSTQTYGRPAEGWHAVQLELSRALYVDERTCEVRAEGFERTRLSLGALIERLGALRL